MKMRVYTTYDTAMRLLHVQSLCLAMYIHVSIQHVVGCTCIHIITYIIRSSLIKQYIFLLNSWLVDFIIKAEMKH